MTDETPLEKYAREMVARRIPPGPKAMCRTADGRWAVKIEKDGETGYLLVDSTFHVTGGVFTSLDELAQLGVAAHATFSVRSTD